MIYSGWKFILFLVFGGMTSNFICLTFSILRSSSLWRIATIFLSLDKAVYRPVFEPQEEHEAESAFLKNKNFVFVTFRLPQVN